MNDNATNEAPSELKSGSDTGLEAGIGKGVKALALFGGYVLVAVMLLTVVAVFSRKILNSPIIGIQDISEVCLILMVFSAIAYAGWTGGHIAVDLIADVVGKPVLRIIDLVMRFIATILLAVLAWQSGHRAIEAYADGETTNLINIPLHPFFWVITIGFSLFALTTLFLTIRAARGVTEFPEQ